MLSIVDESVTIKNIENSIIERAFANGWVRTTHIMRKTEFKVFFSLCSFFFLFSFFLNLFPFRLLLLVLGLLVWLSPMACQKWAMLSLYLRGFYLFH